MVVIRLSDLNIASEVASDERDNFLQAIKTFNFWFLRQKGLFKIFGVGFSKVKGIDVYQPYDFKHRNNKRAVKHL